MPSLFQLFRDKFNKEVPDEKTMAETDHIPAVKSLRERVIEVIKTCYDPEIPVDIWELGLIYEIKIGRAHV